MFGPVGEANVTLGNYNQFRGTLDYGNKLSDAVAWRLNAMYENSESFRNGFSLERYAVNPTMTYAWSAQTALTLGIRSNWQRSSSNCGAWSARY